MAASELQMILEKDEKGVFQMFACRGAGKGCQRNRYRERQKSCADCLGPLDKHLTLGQVQDLVRRGN